MPEAHEWLPMPAMQHQCLTLASLAPGREDVEDLCNAAVKEEAIETKLKAVDEQWAQEIFTFADHKSRGPVVLKVGGWGEGVGMNALLLCFG